MPELTYVLLNWGFLVLSVGAVALGIVLTKGRVRLLLGAGLAFFVLHLALGWVSVPEMTQAGMIAVSLAQGLLTVGSTCAFIAAAVVGHRAATASQAKLKELTDEQPQGWTQPESMPDPRLLAD